MLESLTHLFDDLACDAILVRTMDGMIDDRGAAV
jgi:hypothetical protein